MVFTSFFSVLHVHAVSVLVAFVAFIVVSSFHSFATVFQHRIVDRRGTTGSFPTAIAAFVSLPLSVSLTVAAAVVVVHHRGQGRCCTNTVLSSVAGCARQRTVAVGTRLFVSLSSFPTAGSSFDARQCFSTPFFHPIPRTVAHGSFVSSPWTSRAVLLSPCSSSCSSCPFGTFLSWFWSSLFGGDHVQQTCVVTSKDVGNHLCLRKFFVLFFKLFLFRKAAMWVTKSIVFLQGAGSGLTVPVFKWFIGCRSLPLATSIGIWGT